MPTPVITERAYVLEYDFSRLNEPATTCPMFGCGAYATVKFRVWDEFIICQEDDACDDHEVEIGDQIRSEWRSAMLPD